MDESTDRQLDRQIMDELTDIWKDGIERINRQYRQMDELTKRQTDKQVDGKIDRQMDRSKDRQTNRRTDGWK